MPFRLGAFAVVLATLFGAPAGAFGQVRAAGEGLLELRFTPVKRAQIAIWIEREDGEFISTVRLTESTAQRGIGNRPGASQMNSGFRWPYGRREGVLPIWAKRRAAAPGAQMFKTVIFQDRRAEGLASRTSNDQSPDDYFCLSFDQTRSRQSALDAVSCASPFNSDKGRFITEEDVLAGYGEPYESPGQEGLGRVEPLPLESLYPPRSDSPACSSCLDHPDHARFSDHVRSVMPEIDAVTMATPAGKSDQRVLSVLPADLDAGTYRVCLEVNTEGDHNAAYGPSAYPTPSSPMGLWDQWALNYGYPYRGQPSVVYCVEFPFPAGEEMMLGTSEPVGAVASWDTVSPVYGELGGMEGMTDDPQRAPGSGADRLQRVDGGDRLIVVQQPGLMCERNGSPGGVTKVKVREHPDTTHAHEWVRLSFEAASDDVGIFEYEVRVSREPIVDERTFLRATPAKQATVEAEAIEVPNGVPAGDIVEVELGGLSATTEYYVGVRAMDGCAATGAIGVAPYTTPARQFTTVSPCFVATAAFGTPLAAEIGVLRRFRDRYLLNHAPGRALVAGYYAWGPVAARAIAAREELRAAARWVLSPLIAAAELLDD